jgi:hypothetical protein
MIWIAPTEKDTDNAALEIESISPWLRGTSYPGLTERDVPTPTGLRLTGRAKGHNPFKVEDVGCTVSQGSPCRATLGWSTESLWDSRMPARRAHDLEQRPIQNLRRTRDLLLPRLLAGQVELKTEGA